MSTWIAAASRAQRFGRRGRHAFAFAFALALALALALGPAATAAQSAAPPEVPASASAPASAAGSIPAPVPAPVAGAASAPTAPVEYHVLCQYVLTPGYFESIERPPAVPAAGAPAPGVAALSSPRPYPDPTACPTQLTREDDLLLDGPGDMIVVVNGKGYDDALKRSSDRSPLRLFLNGFDLGTDGLVAGAERRGDKVALRFRVPNDRYSQPFWTAIYNERGIVQRAPLQASVGWSADPAFILEARTPLQLYVSVSSLVALAWATALAALLIWFFLWALWGSDTFRVAPTYPWWTDARSLQTKLHRAAVPFWLWPFQRRRTVRITAAGPRTRAILAEYYGDYAPADEAVYLRAAQDAIAGKIPPPDEVGKAVVGLALTSDWRRFRLPFSLARVQWGGWMMFATTAAVFLWLVYGRFPVLESSVLGLVAVSTLTAGASLIIENGSDKRNTSYSRGFFADLMTDADGVQQAHRYQAIVVNILLFTVGALYVFRHLAYPTFDSSWLELLGLSGLAQVAGKGTLEDKSGTAGKNTTG